MLWDGIRGQTHWDHNHRQVANLITWTTVLSNSMKLGHAVRGHPRRLSWWRGLRRCRPLEKGMENHFSILALRTPWTVWKGKMIEYWKEKLPGSVGAQYSTGDQWRNNSKKNEGMEPKQKQYPVANGTGDGSKVWCCKEQYCIGTWNVRSMNQGKLEVVKQEMTRVNTF